MNKFLLTACASAMALAFAGQALAADQRAEERAPTAAPVSLAKVDFQDKASVKAFYNRLVYAAREVCDSGVSDRSIRRADAACERAAIDRAVSELQRPLLTARRDEKTNIGYARGY